MITKLNIEMVHLQSWKHVYFWGQKVKSQRKNTKTVTAWVFALLRMLDSSSYFRLDYNDEIKFFHAEKNFISAWKNSILSKVATTCANSQHGAERYLSVSTKAKGLRRPVRQLRSVMAAVNEVGPEVVDHVMRRPRDGAVNVVRRVVVPAGRRRQRKRKWRHGEIVDGGARHEAVADVGCAD